MKGAWALSLGQWQPLKGCKQRAARSRLGLWSGQCDVGREAAAVVILRVRGGQQLGKERRGWGTEEDPRAALLASALAFSLICSFWGRSVVSSVGANCPCRPSHKG